MGGKITKNLQNHLRNLKIFYIFAAHSAKQIRSQKSLDFLKVVEQSTTFSFFCPVLLHHLETVIEILPDDI